MDPDASRSEYAPPAASVGIVERPPPGTLARGVWEAPEWAFYAGAAGVVLAAILYLAWRAGLLRRRGPRS